MKLIRMHHSNPVSWVFMPQLIQRARAFSDKYELDLDADFFEEALRLHFIAKRPTMFAWALVDGSKVIGHVINSLDAITDFEGNIKKRYITVLQIERDQGVNITNVVREQIMNILHELAQEFYCDGIQALAEGSSRVNYFKKFGFKVKKTLMRIEEI